MREIAYTARSINLVVSVSVSPAVGGFGSVPLMAQSVGVGNRNDVFRAGLDIRA